MKYSVPVEITPESDGGYSVVCLTLPGVVSQGETVEEAIENITEAFQGAVEGYRASDEPIPWGVVEPAPRPIRRCLSVEV